MAAYLNRPDAATSPTDASFDASFDASSGAEPTAAPGALLGAPPAEDAPPAPAPLAALAHAHGVDTSYDPGAGPVPVSAHTLVAVLGALGVDASTPQAVEQALAEHRSRAAARLLPPCLVVRAGRRTALDVPAEARLTIALEDGTDWQLPAGRSHWLPADLPLGRHTLHLRLASPDATSVPRPRR